MKQAIYGNENVDMLSEPGLIRFKGFAGNEKAMY